MKIDLVGKIDSDNASAVESELMERLGEIDDEELVLDAEKLKYISSAGLRVILRVRKTHSDVRIVNVSPEVYEIFDMTGFTQMMTVEKAYRVVSVEGCQVVGRGANGTIYRIDKDNVVKVYNNADALADIQHEREVAKLALVLGIPTAISYDVVRVGDSYGSVFELLEARSLSQIIATEPDRFDWCVDEYVKMLHTIHDTLVPEGKLPDMKQTALDWAQFMREYLPQDSADALYRLIDAVPHDDHMLHGDFHTGNLELVRDEVLLIDMDTLCVGHPIFELASIFDAFVGYGEIDHDVVFRFMGFEFETGCDFWHSALSRYLDTEDEERLREVEDKARIIGYTRMIRRSIRRGGLEDAGRRREIEYWRAELIELLGKYDTLLF